MLMSREPKDTSYNNYRQSIWLTISINMLQYGINS